MRLLEINAGAVCRSIGIHKASLKNPPLSIEKYLSNLEKQSLVRTVNYLKGFSELI